MKCADSFYITLKVEGNYLVAEGRSEGRIKVLKYEGEVYLQQIKEDFRKYFKEIEDRYSAPTWW